MKTEYKKEYAAMLGRDVEYKIYGHAGKPVLFIPCMGGRFYDFENFHMTDTWAPVDRSRARPGFCDRHRRQRNPDGTRRPARTH